MLNIKNIEKDFFYSQLYKEFGEDYIIKAGYFENETQDNCLSDDELRETLKLLCTPLPSIDKLQDNSVVLLNTGCYNPVHMDHFRLLENAKLHLEKMGMHVACGFLAPDSDSYVKTKGGEYLNINQRIERINKFSNLSSGWITADPWAGIYMPYDVNFTTIYRRLQLYMEKYLGRILPIYYVCGSDRGEFSYTFKDKCVVIERYASSSDVNPISSDIHPDAIYVEPLFRSTHSSSAIRNSSDWKVDPPAKRDLILRVDDANFDYSGILNPYFNSIKKQYEGAQQFLFNSIINQYGNLINLDTLLEQREGLKRGAKLEISRFYNFGGIDFKNYSNRIGTPEIELQLQKLDPNRDYYLFDDDEFTGGTFKFANKVLDGFKILGNITLVKSNKNKYEVLDLRDFIIGENSGLAIEAPNGERFRAPYMYPFVDPFIRASVPNPWVFSHHMWYVNQVKFKHNDCTVGSSSAYDVFKYIGFNETDMMSDVCAYFVNQFNLVKP